MGRGSKPPDSKYSFGAKIELFKDVYLSANYKHNNEIGFTIAADLNTKIKTPSYPQKFYKSSLDMKKDEFPSGYNPSSWYDRLLLDMSKAGLTLRSADYEPGGREVILEISNKNYRSWPDALGVAIRLADLHLPENFKIGFIVNEEDIDFILETLATKHS